MHLLVLILSKLLFGISAQEAECDSYCVPHVKKYTGCFNECVIQCVAPAVLDIEFPEYTAIEPNGVLDESNGVIEICILRSVNVDMESRVDVSYIDGSALLGGDYAAKPITLVFGIGSQRQCFDIAIREDEDDVGNDETFSVLLSNPVDATIGAQSSATVIIMDDDSVGSGFGSF